MQKSVIISILVALALGGVGGYLVGSGKNHPLPGDTSTSGESIESGGQHATTPNDMVQELLSRTGIARDETFIENMITLHESQVSMAKLMLGKTERPELKEFAQSIVDSNTSEIETLKGYLAKWYGR